MMVYSSLTLQIYDMIVNHVHKHLQRDNRTWFIDMSFKQWAYVFDKSQKIAIARATHSDAQRILGSLLPAAWMGKATGEIRNNKLQEVNRAILET